jgi:hypothetical protein
MPFSIHGRAVFEHYRLLVSPVFILRMHLLSVSLCLVTFTTRVSASDQGDASNLQDLVSRQTKSIKPNTVGGQGDDCTKTFGLAFQPCEASQHCYAPMNGEACCAEGDSACKCKDTSSQPGLIP